MSIKTRGSQVTVTSKPTTFLNNILYFAQKCGSLSLFSVLEDPAVLEPLYRLDKVPGDNPAYYCDLGPLGRLLDVKDFTVIPNPSDT
ncbi:hypothetical protein LOZ58_005227 [Ophidiomyces ophidiicola]|nr:hypothetical protein LOZ58_005227 [Ophidiomyces ophidiicola]